MNPIKRIRTNIFGLSQAAFAEIAGVKQASVSRWESSSNPTMPTLAEMKAIRDAALIRGLNWNDSFFFNHPVTPANDSIIELQDGDENA